MDTYGAGMRKAPGQIAIQHTLAALPGWLLLLAGLALVALAVLTPAWLEYEQLAWHQKIMAAHSEHLSSQAQRYVQLQTALESEDPVLLERLAFVELGLKPVGRDPLLAYPGAGAVHHFASSRGGGGSVWSPVAGHGLANAADEGRWLRPVSAWPARPLPRIGRELPVYEPPDTRLTRLTRGRSRFGLIAAGALCLLAACYPGMWTHREQPHQQNG